MGTLSHAAHTVRFRLQAMPPLHTQVPKTKTPTFEFVDLHMWDHLIPICSIFICDIVYFIGFGFQTLILSTHLLQLSDSNHN